MPLGDVTYVNAALDALVGSWPATGALYRLYESDPALETVPASVELSGSGYTPPAFASAGWAAAADGGKATTSPVSFGTSTAAYTQTATYWAVVDSGGLLVFSDALTEPIDVPAAGTVVAFTPSLTFADGD